MQVQWHGSPGQLGLRVTWFLGHWVAGSQNVTQFHVWWLRHTRADCLETGVSCGPCARKKVWDLLANVLGKSWPSYTWRWPTCPADNWSMPLSPL